MFKNSLLLIICSLISTIAISQNDLSSSSANVQFRVRKSNAVDSKAIGSPYVSDAFSPAVVNTIEDTVFVRYNATEDLIEFKFDDSQIWIMDKKSDYTVSYIDGSGFVYNTVKYNDGKRGFAMKIWGDDDKNAIYKRQNIKYSPGREKANSYEGDIPPKYAAAKDEYYVKIAGTDYLMKLPKNKKNLAKLFNDDRSRTLILKSNVNPKNIDELVELFKKL